MKRLIFVTGVLLIAYVILVAALSPSAEPAAPTGAAVSHPSTAQGVYTLTEDGGRVAVLLDGVLYLRTNVPVDLLPKADRERLSEGVEFSSVDEMRRALEDYSG